MKSKYSHQYFDMNVIFPNLILLINGTKLNKTILTNKIKKLLY
ncbi:MAG: hypothetical protein U9R23_01535 [Candidatus Cloacimonadota bacterium]|nr:hypothetical protein [Candidatus Cloacimonadota bacterium]